MLWASGNAAYVNLYVNGVDEVGLMFFETSASETMFVGVKGSTDLDLTAGDYIEVFVRQTDGTAYIYTGDIYQSFS